MLGWLLDALETMDDAPSRPCRRVESKAAGHQEIARWLKTRYTKAVKPSSAISAREQSTVPVTQSDRGGAPRRQACPARIRPTAKHPMDPQNANGVRVYGRRVMAARQPIPAKKKIIPQTASRKPALRGGAAAPQIVCSPTGGFPPQAPVDVSRFICGNPLMRSQSARANWLKPRG